MAQASGYLAFVPAALPPEPAITLDSEAIDLLSRADQALGRLDGIATLLPNPDLFVGMYVRKEALEAAAAAATPGERCGACKFRCGLVAPHCAPRNHENPSDDRWKDRDRSSDR